MKYYIIKPSSSKIDDDLIKGLKSIDTAAVFVDNIKEADKCVLQKGWTKSKLAVSEYHMAKENHILSQDANFSLEACENLVYKVWNKPADLTK